MHSQPKNNTAMDAFAIFELERGPWVDQELLKERYVEAAKQAHPDHQPQGETASDAADDRAAAINLAWRTLENPATRVAHFLQLETGQDVTQNRNVPDEIVPLFMELGPLLQEADQSIRKLKAESSAILKSRLFLASSDLMTKLSDIQSKIQQQLVKADSTLGQAHSRWIASDTSEQDQTQILQTAAQLYPIVSFLQRWRDTIAEKSFELMPG